MEIPFTIYCHGCICIIFRKLHCCNIFRELHPEVSTSRNKCSLFLWVVAAAVHCLTIGHSSKQKISPGNCSVIIFFWNCSIVDPLKGYPSHSITLLLWSPVQLSMLKGWEYLYMRYCCKFQLTVRRKRPLMAAQCSSELLSMQFWLQLLIFFLS